MNHNPDAAELKNQVKTKGNLQLCKNYASLANKSHNWNVVSAKRAQINAASGFGQHTTICMRLRAKLKSSEPAGPTPTIF